MRTEQPARSRSRSRRRKKGTTERAAARPRRNPMEEMLEKARISGEKARIWPLRNSNVMIFGKTPRQSACKMCSIVRLKGPKSLRHKRKGGMLAQIETKISCACPVRVIPIYGNSGILRGFPLKPGANAHFSDCGSNAAVPIGEAGGGDPSAWRLGANTYLKGGGRVCVSFSSATALHPGVCSYRKPDK